jgi:hypothetical protein
MRKACEPKDMPAPATVYRWLAQKKDFRERYTRAREAQADLFFDQILEIADDATGDVKVIPQKDGSTVTKIDHENVHRARLRVDARKWIVARLAPKKYGDEHAVFAPHLDDEGKPVGPVSTSSTRSRGMRKRVGWRRRPSDAGSIAIRGRGGSGMLTGR